MNCDWKGWGADPADDEPWAADADAWRGDVHGTDERWRAGVPDAARSADADAADHTWRGDLHLEDWPEWDAGPEYLMWKTLRDRDAES